MKEESKNLNKDPKKPPGKGPGKGMRPIIGYNLNKWYENYDRIFRKRGVVKNDSKREFQKSSTI